MADPMKIRANVVGDSTEVKVLMNHEMETGQRKDAQGKIDPGVVHPERDRDAQRQDRAGRAVGPGGRRRTRSCRSSSRAARRATRCRSPGPTTRATSAPTRRRSPDACREAARPTATRDADRRKRTLEDQHERCPAGGRSPASPCSRPPSRSPSARSAQGSDRRRDREVPRRRCRTAIRPSCGKRAARACGRQPRGPKKVSLEQCDLGLGPGVVKGAYAEMPRYFADADRVMDLETRLVWCMVTLQGFTPRRTRSATRSAARTARRTWRRSSPTSPSRVARREDERARCDHPKEREAYALGEKMFYFRGGPHDFACATCHGEDNKRIRLQDLPNLTQDGGRAEGLHDVARVPRVAGRAALVPVAPLRLLPPAALPRARVRVATRRSR